MSATYQAQRLEADGCRVIVSLDDAAPVKRKRVEREELERLARPGTVVKFVWLFLLADPRKRYATAMRRDLAAWLAKLVDGRGAIIKDLEAGLTTENPTHRRALLAVADEMIGRSCQGKKSALNGKVRRGRAELSLTARQLKDAKAVWRNLKDYPTWDAAESALEEVAKGFTRYRAHKLWGPRH